MPLKRIELESLILAILEEKKETNLREIAENAGFSAKVSADRRAIQRALANLIKKDIIQAEGNARARIYILKSSQNKLVLSPTPLFYKTPEILQDVSKPLRRPVSYDQNFLKSYIPNETFYLTSALREELFIAGHVENVARPAGTYARTILNRLLIDLSWNSSRLEGNTYSLLETKRLLEIGENAAGKDAIETQMILNHKEAIEYIVESANENTISSHEIFSIHALLSENLLGDPSASGRLRTIAVGISGTTYLPLDNPHRLKEYFDIFIKKLNLIKDPFEQSFFALAQLSYLQAFEDVNKRTARLVSNIPLIKKNLKPLSFVDVNQKDYVTSLLGIYEKNDVSLLRELYIWAYKRSAQKYSALQQTLGEPNLFKLKYRNIIRDIIRTIVLKMVPGPKVVSTIKNLIEDLKLSKNDSTQLFQLIEVEIMSLHNGNIARFKIRPSEFQKWKDIQ